MPRALVDAQLPPALARLLVENRFDADHVADIGWQASSDAEIWLRSRDRYDLIVTKDEDFLPLSQLQGPRALRGLDTQRQLQPSRSAVLVHTADPDTAAASGGM